MLEWRARLGCMDGYVVSESRGSSASLGTSARHCVLSIIEGVDDDTATQRRHVFVKKGADTVLGHDDGLATRHAAESPVTLDGFFYHTVDHYRSREASRLNAPLHSEYWPVF